MKVLNIHERLLPAPLARASFLLERLAFPDDTLWPKQHWPAIRFDTPGVAGGKGGHGPVRYSIESIEPGRAITFRFSGPRGFDGIHRLSLLEVDASTCMIRHVIDMDVRGPALLSWPLVFRPMHDALLEDGLDLAEHYCGGAPKGARWSVYVRLLRWLAVKAFGQISANSSRR